MEEWRPIQNFPQYEVSNLGNVRSKRKNILRHGYNMDGYKTVSLHKNKERKTKSIHRLVAETFLEPVEGKIEVDHINRDKTDNKISNLRWADRSDQMLNCQRKLSSSGHKHIVKHSRSPGYIFQYQRKKERHCKYFKTLEEAIAYRDSILTIN